MASPTVSIVNIGDLEDEDADDMYSIGDWGYEMGVLVAEVGGSGGEVEDCDTLPSED